MSNPTKETLEDEKGKSDDRTPNQRTEPSQEWETMARAWITAFPDAKADVSSSEVETWIGSNFDSLPADLRVMPRSEVVDRLLSMQHYMRPTPLSDHHEVTTSSRFDTFSRFFLELRNSIIVCFVTKQQNVEENHNNQSDQHPARFQRTDQWLPVYSWLESLDHGDLVKSKDISEWLDANPEVKDELSSRHSRYHLTHYVKKCHLKILKRKEKKVNQETLHFS